MKTGQTVDELGLYSTECCNQDLIFDLGDTFARCPQCQHLCQWELEDELFRPDDLERLDKVAA